MNFHSVIPSFRASIRRIARRLLRKTPDVPPTSVLRLPEAAFLALFKLDTVAAALGRGDPAAARAALLEHYGRRVSSDWPLMPNEFADLDLDLARLERDELVALADRLAEHRLTFGHRAPEVALGSRIDWNANPLGDREWALTLHRHQWWPILGLAYAQTGNECYAEEFVTQLMTWIEQSPMPPYKSEGRPHWRLMEVSFRICMSWTHAFALFFHARAFSDDVKLTMLRVIYDHAHFLVSFKTRGNHLIRESMGLAYVGTFFPEFSEAESWVRLGLTRLKAELLRQVNQDGFQSEVSTGYQWLVTDAFRQAFDFLPDTSPVLTRQELGSWLAKMYAALAYVIRPDGTYPQINDGVMDADHLLRNRIVQASELFGRDDLLFIGSSGTRGAQPLTTSIGFDDAGLYVMRSDWTGDARYLLFDAGPFGGNHGHEDKLSIEVYAYGQPFIVDPGSYTYAFDDPFRAYFVGSLSHNTVIVDGKSQIRRWQPGALEHAARPGNYASWISRADLDYTTAVYSDGHGDYQVRPPFDGLPRIVDVTHRRHVLFVKPDYWVLVDELRGAYAHTYELLFHAAPGLQAAIQAGGRVVLGAEARGSRLLIAPADPGLLTVRCVSGSTQPIQGWYSAAYYHKTPTTTVIYARAGAASTTLVTLLYPYPTGQSLDQVHIDLVPASTGKLLACIVQTPKGSDRIVLSGEGTPTVTRAS